MRPHRPLDANGLSGRWHRSPPAHSGYHPARSRHHSPEFRSAKTHRHSRPLNETSGRRLPQSNSGKCLPRIGHTRHACFRDTLQNRRASKEKQPVRPTGMPVANPAIVNSAAMPPVLSTTLQPDVRTSGNTTAFYGRPRSTPKSNGKTFTTPIIPPASADPWIVAHHGAYYYCESRNQNSIWIRKSDRLTELG